MDFEWHDEKAAVNAEKHGVTFAEAKTVFADPFAVIIDDPDHSEVEAREIIIGYSTANRLLFVSYTERIAAIRIISARVATRQERKDYEANA